MHTRAGPFRSVLIWVGGKQLPGEHIDPIQRVQDMKRVRMDLLSREVHYRDETQMKRIRSN